MNAKAPLLRQTTLELLVWVESGALETTEPRKAVENA